MDAYRNAVMRNPGCFEGKVVLDVGTGSGVLAIWAAKAGAKKVYAVEATSMTKHARRLVEHNGLQDVVTILEGYMEQQTLPEKVDIIISEWMGYFLLRESMFDSVIVARDNWLVPGGAMFPSHAQLHMAPLCSKLYYNRFNEYDAEKEAWLEFEQYMVEENDLKVDNLREAYDKEQMEYLLQSAQWCQVPSSEVIGQRFSILSLDAHTCTKQDVTTFKSDFRTTILLHSTLNAFAGWFDVQFGGSAADPTPNPVELTTAPSNSTHWAQQVFMVHPQIAVHEGDELIGTVEMTRQKLNYRLLWVQVRFSVMRGSEQIEPERTINFRVD